MFDGEWSFFEELENGRDQHNNDYPSSDVKDSIKFTPASEYIDIYWATGFDTECLRRNKYLGERKERFLYKQLRMGKSC